MNIVKGKGSTKCYFLLPVSFQHLISLLFEISEFRILLYTVSSLFYGNLMSDQYKLGIFLYPLSRISQCEISSLNDLAVKLNSGLNSKQYFEF